jgi:acetolactate synthase-1/2/3 large subunit
MKLSDYVMDRIAQAGVRHVFMLPGGGCMHLCDSLGKHPQLEFVCCLHEQAVSIAADAYAQYTNELGVGLVTTGPGGTNAVTGVAAAWLDSTPCLFLSGQVKRDDSATGRGVRQLGFQEIDIVSMVTPVTKYAVRVDDPQRIRFELEKALYLARNGRPGPVWLDVPLDVQAADVDPERMAAYRPDAPSGSASTTGVAPELVTRIYDALARAERPVVMLGNGVRLARAQETVLSLVRRLGLPLLTTWKALDFVAEDDPLFVGRPGSIGQRGANFAQQNADFLLAIGARLDFGQAGYDRAAFARYAHKVIVDVDPSELAKLRPHVQIEVAADAADFAAAMLRAPEAEQVRAPAQWLQRCKAWQHRYPVVLPEYRAQPEHVNQYVLIDELSEQMTPEDLMIPGSSGACSEATMQAFRVKLGTRVFNSEGLGPMGFGIPAAIGGCLAAGGRRTVSVDGDGGFVMNIQELETLRRLALPVKIFVLCNNGYGSIRGTQLRYFDGRLVASGPSSGLTLPSMARVAEAFGLRTLRIDNHAQLRDGVRAALAGNDPVVVEVSISEQQTTMPRLQSRQLADGRMASTPLEDLFPFLPRDEFLANMLVPVAKDEA